MSTNEILDLRQRMHEEIRVRTLLEKSRRGSLEEIRAAVMAARKAFYLRVNRNEPALAKAVLAGFTQVYGRMPLNPHDSAQLAALGRMNGAGWEFTYSTNGKASLPYRFSWETTLPAGFEKLGREMDGAGSALPLVVLSRAGTPEGHQLLRESCRLALKDTNPAVTRTMTSAQALGLVRKVEQQVAAGLAQRGLLSEVPADEQPERQRMRA